MRLKARLTDVAITTFLADRDAVQARLPEGVAANVHGTDGLTAVSAVSFVLGRLNVWPWARIGHVDYRAYVRHDEQEAVWFLGAAMDSGLSRLLRWVWRMPWHRARVDVARDATAYCLAVRSADGDAEVRAVADGPADAVVTQPLIEPLVGLFGDTRSFRRYEVRHGPLVLERADAPGARVELFERLGLVAPGAAPASVLLVEDFDIEIVFPPRRVRRRG